MSRPTGTVTFLLTDIEGSTRLREERGPAFELALTLHHRLLRDVFVRHGGHEVKELGDGFIVAFEQPTDAVACAPWPDGVPLRVRMALHTGEIDLVDGEYRGLTLHHGARLLSATHGGQILCSEGTAVLLRRGLDPGVRLVDLGAFRLRDIESPERLFQVSYPDMPAGPFPPPRAEAAYGSQLPATFTRFFGREAELAWLRETLLREDTRLVTMTGPGGSGKTRLSIEAARRLLDPFRGAVWFVPLQEVRDASLLAGAIVDAMKLPRSPQLDPLDQAVAALSKQPALLVLDNFEQVVDDGAAVVLTLLERAPSTRYLVTSRRTLDLTPEVEYFLAPLPTPDREYGVESVMQCESVRLFVDRAQAARPDFEVTPANAQAVGELCERLEGIPLALELAAVRAQVLTPTQMLAQLDHRLDFLASRRRDIPERHRTLRAAIDWSYESLPPDLQRLFTRLSIFRGGWTIEAAETVCEDPMALDHLERLRECSLVLLDTDQTGETRLGLLETLREYAQELLPHEDVAALRDRHADYFLTTAETLHMERPGLLPAWAEREAPNIVGALEWLEARDGGLDRAMRLWCQAGEASMWLSTGRPSEGRRHADLLFAQDRAAAPTRLRAEALLHAGILALMQGDRVPARALFEETVGVARAVCDGPILGRALVWLGSAAREQTEVDVARDALEEASALSEELGLDDLARDSIVGLAMLAVYQGRLPEAYRLLNEGAALDRRLHPEGGTYPGILVELACIARQQGQYEESRALLTEALGMLPGGWQSAWAVANLGHLAVCEGDYPTARSLLEEALAAFRSIGNADFCANCLLALGTVATLEGDHAAARALTEEAMATWEAHGLRSSRARGLAALGSVVLLQGDHDYAEALCVEGLTLARDACDPGNAARCLEVFAGLCVARKEMERAARVFAVADATREKMGVPVPLCDRGDYDRQVADARAALGDEAFAAAWAEGGAMTWQDAVAYALAAPPDGQPGGEQ